MIKLNMSNEEYHAHSALSRSALALIDKTPRHFQAFHLDEEFIREEKDALNEGTIFHTLALEPHDFAKKVHVWSGAPRNTKAGKEEYAEALKGANGKIVVKEKTVETIQAMVKSMLSEPAAKKVLGGEGNIEASYFWDDPETGVNLKCRPDYVRKDGLIIDLKTCSDASPDGFSKSLYNYHYDMQAYMCMTGIELAGGDKPKGFIFAVVEKTPPYISAFYFADETVILSGEAKFKRLIKIYKACLDSGKWPGYGSLIQPISIPEWALYKMTEGSNE